MKRRSDEDDKKENSDGCGKLSHKACGYESSANGLEANGVRHARVGESKDKEGGKVN